MSDDEAMGRAQRPGVAREDFSRPVHNDDEPVADDDSTDSTDSTKTDAKDAAEPRLEGLFEKARQGLGRLRHEAEEGFERLRKEAEARIADTGERDTPGAAPKPPAKPARHTGVERVSIRVVGRRVRVVGDSRVTTASADGPHQVRRRGPVVEITSEGDVGPSTQGFSLFRPPRSFDDVKSMGLGPELVITMNPALTLDAEVTGGSLRTENVERIGKVRVTVGGARLAEIEQAEDVLIQAGPGTVSGTFRSGHSRVRCESGSLTVSLARASNVTVRAEAQLGRVGWAGGHTGAADEVVLGDGAARLDVGVVMGAATIRTQTD